MATATEVRALNAVNENLKASARNELRTIMSRADPAGPEAVREVLLAVMPILVNKYGAAASAVSAEWLEAIVGLSNVVIPDTFDAAALAAGTRWAVGPAFPPADPKAAAALGRQVAGLAASNTARLAVGGILAAGAASLVYSRAEGVLLRHALQGGRATVAESSLRSRVGYARILQGDKSCAFCVMAAGRGATYSSARSAGQTVGRGVTAEDAAARHLTADSKARAARAARGVKVRGKTDRARKLGDDFHDHCNCTVVAIRDETDWPEDYDIDGLTRMYEDAVDEAGLGRVLKGGTPGPNPGGVDDPELSVLQVMRRNYGLK